ncbi:MAG: hypothetical protein ACK4ZY_12865, partial [Sphingomonas sp.]
SLDLPAYGYGIRYVNGMFRQRLDDGVLYRAIDDAKRPCQGIAEAVRQGDRQGKPVWAVRCIDGSAWLIALGDDGMADVTGIPGRAGG